MNKKKNLVIIGIGEFAQIAHTYFQSDSHYDVIAFAADELYIKSEKVKNLPVIPLQLLTKELSPDQVNAFIAVTYTRLNRDRLSLYNRVKEMGYNCASYISTRAYSSSEATIGENTFIFENNVIQTGVNIGNNCIIWSGNHIGHQSVIKNNVYISSHVTISGYCTIEDNCFIGVNSCLADNIKIAKDCVIGMGATVNKTIKIPGTVVKSPGFATATATSYDLFKISKEQQ